MLKRLIIQGGYKDTTGEHTAGEYISDEAGSVQHPIALDGEDCIMIAFAHSGIELVDRKPPQYVLHT
ncbi:MAG: hypothetical protein ABR555_01205 [Pyrinomonadaceae bacterium]